MCLLNEQCSWATLHSHLCSHCQKCYHWVLLQWYSLVKKKVKGPFWDLLYIYQTNKDYHIKWKYLVPCTSIYNFGKKDIHSLKPFGYNIQLKNQKFAQLRFSVYFFFDHPIYLDDVRLKKVFHFLFFSSLSGIRAQNKRKQKKTKK